MFFLETILHMFTYYVFFFKQSKMNSRTSYLNLINFILFWEFSLLIIIFVLKEKTCWNLFLWDEMQILIQENCFLKFT